MARMRLGRWSLAVLLFVLPLASLYALRGSWQPCELRIDMQVGDDRGDEIGYVEVWCNSTAEPPLRRKGVPGERHTYQFDLENYQSLDYLRIDPLESPKLRVRLYGVYVCKGSEILRSFTPQDLRGWESNAEQLSLEDDALMLRANHRDPQLAAHFPSLALPGTPRNALLRLGLRLVSGQRDRQTLLMALGMAALIVLMLGLRRGGRLTVAVLAASIPLTYQALKLLRRFGGHPPAGDSALGYALYSGYPKSLEFLNAPLLVAVPALIALLAVYLYRRRASTFVTAFAADTAPKPRSWRKWSDALHLTLLTAALAAYFWPDLAATCPAVADRCATPSWDGGNTAVWQYLVQMGAEPFKDFWYPYSGQVLFALAFPCGEIILALHYFVLFAVLLFAIYLNSGKSLTATLPIFATLFALSAANYIAAMERYGLIINVILTYAAIDRGAPRLQKRHVLFWIAAVQALLFEPASVLYAGIPLAFCRFLDALRSPAEFRAHLLGSLVREFLVPASAILVVGLYLFVRGELSGFLAFLASLGSQAAYGAYPIDIRAWLRFRSPLESFLLWSIVFLTGIGMMRELKNAETNDKAGRIVLLLGIALAVVMLKQLTRPHMAEQILTLSVAGILFYLFACRKLNAWQWGGSVFAIGLLFAFFWTSPLPAVTGRRLASAAARVQSSLPFLTLDKRQRQELVTLRFAPNRFRLPTAHQAVLHALDDLVEQGRNVQPLFVLSDDPLFYILTGTRPYIHTNGYNAAPIEEQKRMIRQFEASPPEIVIWRYTDTGMDGVQPVLRDALIYEYMILHYVPQLEIPSESFALLRRRHSDEPIALDFWRERLGPLLSLGHIPRFCDLTRYSAWSDRTDEEATEFLIVQVGNPSALLALPPPPLKLPSTGGYKPSGRSTIILIDCAGHHFALALSIVPGQTEYHVPLNRVWFWGVLKKAGLSPTLGQVDPGIEVRIERRAENDDILY